MADNILTDSQTPTTARRVPELPHKLAGEIVDLLLLSIIGAADDEERQYVDLILASFGLKLGEC